MGKEKVEWGAFPFLAWVNITKESRGERTRLTFELPSPILEAVKKPSMYVKLNLFIARDLSSKHSLALYEVLKDYQNIGKLRIPINDFRKLIGVEASQYKVFTMLKKRILDVAVTEINAKTDLEIGYQLEKQGRKITAIEFRVKTAAAHSEQETTATEILTKLTHFGFKETTAKEILKKHDEDYILANIRVVEEALQAGKKIRNVTAYLLKAFEVDFRPVETEFEKNRAKQKALELQSIAQRKQEEQAQIEAFENERNAQIDKILTTLDEGVLGTLKEEYLIIVNENPLFKKFLASKGFEHGTIQVHWRNFIAAKFLPKMANDSGEFLKTEPFNEAGGVI